MHEELFNAIRSYYDSRNLSFTRTHCCIRDELDECGRLTLSGEEIRSAVIGWLRGVGALSENGSNIDDRLDELNDAQISNKLGKKLIEIGYEDDVDIDVGEAVQEFLQFCATYAEIQCRLYQLQLYGNRIGYEATCDAIEDFARNFLRAYK